MPFPAEGELNRAAALSPAVGRYRRLLKNFKAEDPADVLRLRRHRAWLASAVPALLGGSDPALACRSWSAAADDFLRETFGEFFGDLGFALFAFGKLGSEELNLSSDVDVVVVSAQDDPGALVRLRGFQKRLSETRATGFALRVDFDLRPGGKAGPLIPTVDQFVDYYGNYGETWERMAFVRLRPIAGDPKIVNAVDDFVARFSYRKHLDYGLLQDLKSLRTKIHAEHWKRSAGGAVDLKLGVGGIRDAELFLHALQVIHGGKDPALRTRSTAAAADLAGARRVLPAEDAAFLKAHYWRLREIENFVQALGDEQTHLLKTETPRPGFVAAATADLPAALERCDRLVASLLGEAPKAPTNEELRTAVDDESYRRHLGEILEIPLLSRNKERDEETRRSFLAKFLETLRAQGADTDMAFEQLKEFLRATRAKASFFELLRREDKLLNELAWLFGHSRYLGRLLCYRPELLDAFVFRAQDLKTGDLETLLEQLVEKRLLAEIIEGSRFLREMDIESTTAALSSTADGIVAALAEALSREHPTSIRVLALGKWGANESGFRSDLDFVFVSPAEPSDSDHKFARRFISRLTEPHRGGNIYPVDMRLRPSGKAGPIIMPADDLDAYLRAQAEPWERQAYLRARWIGEPMRDLRAAIFARAVTAADLPELDRIRRGLLPTTDVLDLKYSEGGLVDLELFAQTRALLEGRREASGHTPSLLRELNETDLCAIYVRLRQIEQLGQLMGSQTFSKIDRNHEALPALAAALKISSVEDVERHVRDLLGRSVALLGRLDPRRTPR